MSIYAGTTFSINRSFVSYPAATYSAQYILINSSNKYTVAGVGQTDNSFTFTASNATTALWAVGTYKYQIYCYISSGGTVTERYLAEYGYIDVLPDMTSESTYDTRSHAKICLDAIEAVLENRATTDQQMYSIAGRQLMRMNIADLLKLRSHYKAEYERECDSAGETNRFRIQTRFV